MRIEYYGHIREQTQKSAEERITNSSTIDALLHELQGLYHIEFPAQNSPSGATPQTFIVAVNAHLIQPTQFSIPNLFRDGDTIAIMPPFSGG
ncbi:MAG: hypothetical protein RBG13Loki_1262 [Promethearchaeota archaeon CR_4]|nr:MAG: hypothetical protein RBG13Loki_1262 [Candidatus Lokiarchaeota archaeon CR_4]